MTIDAVVFSAINGLAGSSPALDWIAVALTNFGIPVLALLVLLARNKKLALKALVAVIAVLAIDAIINSIWFRPRPETAHLLVTASGSSFPSTHAANSFALAMLLFLHKKRRAFAIIAIVIASRVSLSRIFAGVHWASDVVIGAAIGIGVAYGVEKLTARK